MRVPALLFLGLSALLVSVLPAAAQSTTQATLNYFYRGAAPAEVAQYTQAISVDGVAVPGTPACVAVGPDTRCSLALPTWNPTAKTVTSIVATRNGISAELRVVGDPNGSQQGPKPPSGASVTVTITVVVGQ